MNRSPSPGPIYKVQSLLDTTHVHGPVYRPTVGETLSRKPTSNTLRASPSKDRSAWLLGENRDGLAVYKEISDAHGPGHHSPSYGISSKEKSPPRTVFSKSGRFQLNSSIGAGMDQDRIGKEAPGPKYNLREVRTQRAAPSYSFGSSGNPSRRSDFTQAQIRAGYYYKTENTTALCTSLSGNDKDLSSTLSSFPRAPRPTQSKSDRFAAGADKQFVSRKHCRSKIGANSPGPAYFPRGHELGRFSTKPAVSMPGKWVP